MATLAQKACGCKRHADFNAKEDEGSVKLIKLSSKKVKTQVISELKKNNDITDRTMYLCTGCINHVQNDSCISSENVENFLHKIRCQYDNKKLVEIASALGQKVREEICSQAKSSSHHYRILESINDFDTTEYVRSRNVVLTAFLFAVAGEQLETCPINILLYVVMAADCVYACAYPKFVTILCFMVNLLSYIICGSKSVCRIISSVMPSGCYNTIINWLKENSSSSLEVPAKEDIVTFFDNSQILSRNWRVRFDSKVLLSAITTSIHILPPVPSFLQSDASLSPSSWLYSNPDPLLLTSKIRDFITHHESKFSVYRTSFLKVLLNSVRNEMDNGIISDINIADACDVHSLHVGSSSVVTGDPIFLNPCSNQAVRDVLGHIRDNNCKDKRSWSIIGCDGLPYILGSRLIDKSSDLQDIYLIPGLGHFEMNMTKSCFKLLWKVLFEDVAKLMGYKSIKALAACQRCSDHHKAWQLLTIAFVAVSKEIAAQFISECKTRNLEPEIDNFFQHLQNSTNPNVTFLYHSFFTYVFGLFLFRAGERMNNSDIILCSRIKFSTLFFGFNQTFYQEIEMRDTKARVLSPTKIHDFMCKNETFTVSGDVSKGEGGDFILESKNRKIKRMMPPGHPSKDTWTRVVRNADNTDQVIVNNF